MKAGFILLLTLSVQVSAFASLPTNGVLRTNLALNSLLDTSNSSSAYQQCANQGLNFHYFSNPCGKLTDALQKKLNMMTLEADLQMQAEKLARSPLPKPAKNRIELLTQITLLSMQAEESLKSTDDNKTELPQIVSAVQKVQTVITEYAKLVPNGAN